MCAFLDIPEYSTITKQGWKSEKIDSVSMAQLEEAAKKLLDDDEFKAVKRHVKTVHRNIYMCLFDYWLLQCLNQECVHV